MLGREAIALMNTGLPGRPDLLDDPAWLTATLPTWGIACDRELTADDLAEARWLRGLLRSLTRTIVAGNLLTAEELAPFNALLARLPVTARVLPDGDRYVLEMTPIPADLRERALREMAGGFSAMLRVDPARLRICARPGCETVFRDETRSRTRAWCDNRTCGNRVRVNRHRSAAG